MAPLTTAREDGAAVTTILRHSDHILRRFGLAEFVTVDSGSTRALEPREQADEVWALVSGKAIFDWVDERSSSPTHSGAHSLEVTEPTLVLVPFGVRFRVSALEERAELIRLATHED